MTVWNLVRKILILFCDFSWEYVHSCNEYGEGASRTSRWKKRSVHSVAERCIIYIILTLMLSGFSGKVLRLFQQDILNYLKVKLMGSPPLARLSKCSWQNANFQLSPCVQNLRMLAPAFSLSAWVSPLEVLQDMVPYKFPYRTVFKRIIKTGLVGACGWTGVIALIFKKMWTCPKAYPAHICNTSAALRLHSFNANNCLLKS